MVTLAMVIDTARPRRMSDYMIETLPWPEWVRISGLDCRGAALRRRKKARHSANFLRLVATNLKPAGATAASPKSGVTSVWTVGGRS